MTVKPRINAHPRPFLVPPAALHLRSTSFSLSCFRPLTPRDPPFHIRSRTVNKVAVNPEHSSVLSTFGSISVPPVAIRSGLTWTHQWHTSKHVVLFLWHSCSVFLLWCPVPLHPQLLPRWSSHRLSVPFWEIFYVLTHRSLPLWCFPGWVKKGFRSSRFWILHESNCSLAKFVFLQAKNDMMKDHLAEIFGV